MKQQILCETCARDAEKRLGDGSQYPGEHVKYLSGIAKSNPCTESGQSICDYCEKPLPPGTPCVAMTIWSDSARYPYAPWEHEFMELHKKPVFVGVDMANGEDYSVIMEVTSGSKQRS